LPGTAEQLAGGIQEGSAKLLTDNARFATGPQFLRFQTAEYKTGDSTAVH